MYYYLDFFSSYHGKIIEYTKDLFNIFKSGSTWGGRGGKD